MNNIGTAAESILLVLAPVRSPPGLVDRLDKVSRHAAAQSGGDLKPLESLPAFLAGFNQGTLPDPDRSALILSRIPSYFSGAVYDKSHGLALAIFGLTQVTSVERDHVLVAGLDHVGAPPSGYRAFAAGLAGQGHPALSARPGENLPLTRVSDGVLLPLMLVATRPRLRTRLMTVP